jgi:hypothetical protein
VAWEHATATDQCKAKQFDQVKACGSADGWSNLLAVGAIIADGARCMGPFMAIVWPNSQSPNQNQDQNT